MKALLFTALLLTFATSSFGQLTGPKMEMTSPANLQYFMPGSIISVVWNRPASHIGKTINFSIWLYTLKLYNESLSESPAPLLISLVDRHVLGIATNTTGAWTWKIPGDFKPGYYELYISEGADNDIFGDYWDGSRIYIKPELTLAFDKRYGETLRVGSFPSFEFNLKGYDTWTIRIFLKKDGTILGRCHNIQYDSGAQTGILHWDLTQYVTFNGEVLPKIGSGYSLFIGALKYPFKYIAEEYLSLDDFVDSDETDKFSLLSPARLTIHEGVLAHFRVLYIIGEPGARYNLYWSSSLAPNGWRMWQEVKATTEVFSIFDWARQGVGFYKIEEISSLR